MSYSRSLLLLVLSVFTCLPNAYPQELQRADSLRENGEHFKNRGNYSQAEQYLGAALNIYGQERDTSAWLKTGQLYASTLVHRAKYDRALALYRKLLDTDHPDNDKRLRGDLLNSVGWTHNKISNHRKALEYFKKALPLSREAEFTLLTAIIYDNMGYSYKELGDYRKSLEIRKKALPLFYELENKQSIAISLNNIAQVYEQLLLYDRALEYYTRSLEVRKELGNVNYLATIYNNLGILQKKLGNYELALISLEKSLKYRKKAGKPQTTSTTLSNIGTLYSTLGRSQKALEYYRESIRYGQGLLPDKTLDYNYSNLANRLWALGHYEEAEATFKKALAFRKEIGNPRLLADSFLNISMVKSKNRDYPGALQYIRRSLAIADSLKDYELLTEAHIHLGTIYRHQGKPAKALSSFRKSLAYSRFIGETDQLLPLKQLAYHCDRLDSDSALVYGTRAINLIEKGRERAGASAEIRTRFLEQHSNFYTSMAHWSLKYRNDMEMAFRYVELAKARALADELVQASQRVDEVLPEAARFERNKKLKRIEALYTSLREAAAEDEEEKLKIKIRQAELSYSAFENNLRRKYPNYKKLEVREPISLEKAQAISAPGTAILEYSITENRLLVFLISSEQVLAESYTLNNEEDAPQNITGQVQAFKDAILSNAAPSILEKHSAPLYDHLLAPFEETLSSVNKLIIVPDGPLAYLPYEALRIDGRYLIERFNIKYVPSLTTLPLIRTPGATHHKELLAVAGSDFTAYSGNNPVRRRAYSSLPSTLIEVDSVASHFSDVLTLKHRQVSEEALKKLLNAKFRYIHLATHGYIDEDYPGQSGLALSSSQDLSASSAEDGLLKSFEIYRLNLDTEMVVLSACNTGMGKVVGGEGILGLQRAFFYAGSSSVVVSLWNVYDRSTAFLMNEFYKALIKERGGGGSSLIHSLVRWAGWDTSIPYGNKALAMREAKLKLINHPVFNHPVYWAPFILVGR